VRRSKIRGDEEVKFKKESKIRMRYMRGKDKR
jgi:hypothetical protein